MDGRSGAERELESVFNGHKELGSIRRIMWMD